MGKTYDLITVIKNRTTTTPLKRKKCGCTSKAFPLKKIESFTVKEKKMVVAKF